MSPLRSRMQEQDGAIAIMAAVLATAMVLAGALAVDVGRVAYVSRDLQGATDRGALDSVQALRAFDNEASPEALEAVYGESLESLDRNPESGTQRDRLLYRVDLGRADDDAGNAFDEVCGGYFDGDEQPTSRGSLVTAGILAAAETGESAETQIPPDDCAGVEEEVNAVRLWTHGSVDYVLAIGESGTTLHKVSSARATAPPDDPDCPEGDPTCEFVGKGTISAGTTLASMEGGVLDQLLSELVGGSVDADLVGYQGIAEGRIRLGDLVATDALSVGTVDELLATEVSVFDVIEATVSVLEADGSPAAADLALELGELLAHRFDNELAPIRLGHTDEHLGGLDLASGEGAGADVRVDAVELVLTSLQIANQGNALDLDLTVLGEALPVTLTVVEPPVIAEGHPGTDGDGEWLTVARTAQIELDLSLDLEVLVGASSELQSALDSVLDALGGVLSDLLGPITDPLCSILGTCPDPSVELETIDVVLRAADGRSALTDVGCETEGLSTQTTVTSARVQVSGDVLDVGGDVLSLSGGTQLTAGDSEPADTVFEGPVPEGPVRVPDGGSPLNASLSVSDFVQDGTWSESDLEELLSPVTDLLGISLVGDDGILDEVLDQLGLGLSTVDVMAHDVDCTQRSLQPSVAGN